jgi:hypothetical protein
VDPYRALNALEAKAVAGHGLPATTASANTKQVTIATTSAKPPPGPPPGAAELVSGAPAAPIGPAMPPAPKTGAVQTGAVQTGTVQTGAVPPAGKLTVSGIAPSAPAAPVGPAPAATEPDESPATIEKKRQACRQDGAARGVQTSEMADYIAVCVSEAHLACLKQAVAQKVRGPERRDFMNRCLPGLGARRVGNAPAP